MDENNDRCAPQICRLCLALTTTSFSLLENNEASGMLEALTSLRILPSDEISTVMCLKCRLNLKLAFAIQQNMLRAEQRFRERHILKTIKEECEIPRDTESDELNKSNFQELGEINIKEIEKENERDLEKKCEQNELKDTDRQEDSKFTCNICGKKKSSSQRLSVHKYNNHKMVECSACKKPIRKGYIREHMKMHWRRTEGNGKIPVFPEFACDVCGTWKSSKATLRMHKYYTHVERDCPVCTKKLKVANYNRHLFQVHGMKVERVEQEKPVEEPTEEEYTCSICGVKKDSKTSLYKHTSSHRISECPVCKVKIKTANLKVHLERHQIAEAQLSEDSNPEFKCEICGKQHLSKSALTQHTHSSHSRSECPICKKVLSSSNLNNHIKRHAKATTVCEVCGLTVKAVDLKYHMVCHSSIMHKCDFCDKEFKRKNSKVLHERREHTGEANFVCETCGKRFYSAPYLKKHVSAIHLKLKPFACDNCDMSFATRNSLRTHQRQHTNERPYKCEYCGDGFKQKVSLKSHLRSQHDVHEELTCECETCGKKFASKWALLTHSRVHS